MKIIFLLILLVSCAAEVTPRDMEKAHELCAKSGGLHHIHAVEKHNISAVCNYTLHGEYELKPISQGKYQAPDIRYTIYCKKGGDGAEMFIATFASKPEADSFIENTKGCRVEEQ